MVKTERCHGNNEKIYPTTAFPYAYNALEPYIAEEIMRLHHQKHHQSLRQRRQRRLREA
jgi:superoxide dismutase